MKKSFAIFGLGSFGGTLVKEFAELGVDVLAVDIDESKVSHYSEYATHAVVVDELDEGTLKKLGIRNFDHAIVSFGDDIKSSILTCLLLKEMGVPKVWAKAHDDYHAKVLEKIGVDKVIHPEKDMAIRIAHYVVSKKIIDYTELTQHFSIAEVVASEKIHNKTLHELDIRDRFGCNVVAIERGKEIIVSPAPDKEILKGDVLVVIGRNEDISRFDRNGV